MKFPINKSFDLNETIQAKRAERAMHRINFYGMTGFLVIMLVVLFA